MFVGKGSFYGKINRNCVTKKRIINKANNFRMEKRQDGKKENCDSIWDKT